MEVPKNNSQLNNNFTEADSCNKLKEFLTFFETEMLTEETLQIFLEQEEDDVWLGSEFYKILFKSWRKLRRSVTSNSL